MTQFKVGGKVVCIEDRTLKDNVGMRTISIQKGQIYTVDGIDICKCGEVSLNVGFVMPKIEGYIDVSICTCSLETETPIWWIDATYFVPIEEQEFKQVTYTKILDEIPVCAQ